MKNKHTILVIDDDPEILDDLKDSIRSLGYGVITAQNQVLALKILKKIRPCLILLDLALKIDSQSARARIQVGFNLLKRIREKFSRNTLPIILITAHKGQNDSLGIQGMQNDANDMVKKPFKDGLLEQRIEYWIKQCNIHPIKEPTQWARRKRDADGTNLIHSNGVNGTSISPDIKTKDTFLFDGRPNKKRRNLIIINGNNTWVRTKSFVVLWRLAVPLWNGQNGWLKAAQIDDSSNPHQSIYRAKVDITGCVKDKDRTIENNGNQYRLSIPLNCLTYDEGLIRQYFPSLLDLINSKN